MPNSIFDICLVSGNITIFCGTHTQQFKDDILNSSLYAELSAKNQSDDRDISWSTYSGTVQKLCWIVNTRATQRSDFIRSSLLDLVKDSASNYLTNNEQKALTSAFSTLQELPPDSLAVKTLINKLQINASASSASGKAVSTAILLTIVRQDKAVITLQIAFEATKGIAIEILDRPELIAVENGKNNIRLLRSLLDGHRYSQVRDTVIEKLGSKIATELLHV